MDGIYVLYAVLYSAVLVPPATFCIKSQRKNKLLHRTHRSNVVYYGCDIRIVSDLLIVMK